MTERKVIRLLCCTIMAIIVLSCKTAADDEPKNDKPKITKKVKDRDDVKDNDKKDQDPVVLGPNSKAAIRNNKVLRSMLPYINISNALNFSHMRITDVEANEIQRFAESNFHRSTYRETIEDVNNWLASNITYYEQNRYGRPPGIRDDRSINDPYEAFKYRKAICYGYSNLMKVMLNTLGIPAMVVSGGLVDIGDGREAHSWVWAKAESTWIVADPTNNRFFYLNDENSPYHTRLSPSVTDIDMFEDDKFSYNFSDGVNVSGVKTDASTVVIPDEINGLSITTFNPNRNLPSSLKEITLGNNIINLGERAYGLHKYGNMIERISVTNGNRIYNSYEGVLYKNDSNDPIYIPHKMMNLKLKPQETYGKNVVYNRDYIKTITFPKGTVRIKAYAVEHCPSLVLVKVPTEVVIETNAFNNGDGGIKIVRY